MQQSSHITHENLENDEDLQFEKAKNKNKTMINTVDNPRSHIIPEEVRYNNKQR